MYLGRLVEVCPAAEIYASPMHPYTKGLLQAIPIPSARKAPRAERAIEGDIPSPIHPPDGCRFHTRCRHRMPICEKISPELKSMGGGHDIACHLY
ncbi:MAG: ABC transporter ATP-binding protein [Synergistaceae bacterium]|nr:ABC transporter ATP-binding protein [Synergistaceae bacterium]